MWLTRGQRADPQRRERGFVELGKAICDGEPRRLVFDKDVSLRPNSNVSVEDTGRDLRESGLFTWVRYWRAASHTEAASIGGRRLKDRSVVGVNQIRTAEKRDLFATNSRGR